MTEIHGAFRMAHSLKTMKQTNHPFKICCPLSCFGTVALILPHQEQMDLASLRTRPLFCQCRPRSSAG